MKPPHIRGTRLFHSGPDVRLYEKYVEGGFKILANGAGSGWPVLGPPIGYAFYLGGGASSDMKFKGHL